MKENVERKRAPLRVTLAALLGLAAGVGAGSAGTLALQRVLEGSQVIKTGEQFFRLSPIELEEVRSPDEFVRLFDKIFTRLETARLTTKLPNTPDSFFMNVKQAKFSWSTLNLDLQKGALQDSTMRTVIIKTKQEDTVRVTLIGNKAPGLEGLSEEEWQEVSRLLIGHYNSFSERYNDLIHARENPYLFK